MFDHSTCSQCNANRAEAKRLQAGRQSVGIGQVSPEALRADKLLSAAWQCEFKSEGEYLDEQERLWQERRSEMLANGYVEVWDFEEREDVLIRREDLSVWLANH